MKGKREKGTGKGRKELGGERKELGGTESNWEESERKEMGG